MNLDELIKSLKVIESGLMQKYPELKNNKDKHILAYTAKTSEEYGELMNEVMASLNLQRPEKLATYDPQNLAKEFADVLISLMLLGLALDIDIEKAIIEMVKAKVQAV